MKTCSPACSVSFTASEATLQQEQHLANQAKALSHPARVRILKILLTLEQQGGCLNSDLVSELGLAQSTVSEHLRILKLAGFITAESMPPKMCYRINQAELDSFQQHYQSIFS